MNNPLAQSTVIAKLIWSDPISAGMVKDHISPADLRGLLNIDKSTEEFFEDLTNDQLWVELDQRLRNSNYRFDLELIAALEVVKEKLL